MREVYTISVSKIESFDKWTSRQTEDNESYNNEENFLATLKGQFKQLPSAKYGECFHAIIEDTAEYVRHTYKDQKGELQSIDVMKYKEAMIPFTQAKHAIAYREAHPMMTKELPVSKRYQLRDCDLIVTGRADGIEGNWVRDTKTKYSNPDDVQDDYINALQWRFYLDILNMDMLLYDIFVVSGFKTLDDCLTAKITPWEPLPVKRYPTLEQDLHTPMEDLMEYLRFKNLLQYVEIPIISPVAVQYDIYKDLAWNDSTVLNFGKHLGKTLGEVPEYLQWLYSNKPLPAGLKQYMITKKLIA